MTRSKVAVLDVQVTVNVEVQARATAFNFATEGEAVKPLFYRRAEYLLPAHVVDAPMPTLTVRHLEKATIHLLQKKDEQALLAFKRAVASGVEIEERGNSSDGGAEERADAVRHRHSRGAPEDETQHRSPRPGAAEPGAQIAGRGEGGEHRDERDRHTDIRRR